MPLSEDEQRILSEIEQQLYQSDPALARDIAFELVDGGLHRVPALVEEVDALLPEGDDAADAERTEFLFKS